MKIAILVTNVDESDFAQARPKDGEKWRSLLSPLAPEWEFPVYLVKDGAFPETLDGLDGLVVTGSPASVHDDAAWIAQLFDLIRDAADARLPMFGACFGHQAITLALGGKVGQNPQGWDFGVTEVAVSKTLPWMQGAGTAIKQHAAHIEQVHELPAGAEVYIGIPSCPVGGFVIADHVFTSQYHPEITREFMRDLIDEVADQKPVEVIEAARESMKETPDNNSLARWIVEFFKRGRGAA